MDGVTGVILSPSILAKLYCSFILKGVKHIRSIYEDMPPWAFRGSPKSVAWIYIVEPTLLSANWRMWMRDIILIDLCEVYKTNKVVERYVKDMLLLSFPRARQNRASKLELLNPLYPPWASYNTTQHHTTLHHTTPHYTTLHYTTLHYTTLHLTLRKLAHVALILSLMRSVKVYAVLGRKICERYAVSSRAFHESSKSVIDHDLSCRTHNPIGQQYCSRSSSSSRQLEQ